MKELFVIFRYPKLLFVLVIVILISLYFQDNGGDFSDLKPRLPQPPQSITEVKPPAPVTKNNRSIVSNSL